MSDAEVARIAVAARELVAAHKRRAKGEKYATLAERMAIERLRLLVAPSVPG
jgi:hypothetical protein